MLVFVKDDLGKPMRCREFDARFSGSLAATARGAFAHQLADSGGSRTSAIGQKQSLLSLGDNGNLVTGRV